MVTNAIKFKTRSHADGSEKNSYFIIFIKSLLISMFIDTYKDN